MAKQMNAQSQFDRVTEITKQLEEGIQNLFESVKFKAWLTTMSRFHDYSLNNTPHCQSEAGCYSGCRIYSLAEEFWPSGQQG